MNDDRADPSPGRGDRGVQRHRPSLVVPDPLKAKALGELTEPGSGGG
ncbi:hypothetical protein GWI34_33230 [Actinomadura sp. DSM 109109]|nr:hypothetical protein [Actinomadura lepetitiana]